HQARRTAARCIEERLKPRGQDEYEEAGQQHNLGQALDELDNVAEREDLLQALRWIDMIELRFERLEREDRPECAQHAEYSGEHNNDRDQRQGYKHKCREPMVDGTLADLCEAAAGRRYDPSALQVVLDQARPGEREGGKRGE